MPHDLGNHLRWRTLIIGTRSDICVIEITLEMPQGDHEIVWAMVTIGYDEQYHAVYFTLEYDCSLLYTQPSKVYAVLNIANTMPIGLKCGVKESGNTKSAIVHCGTAFSLPIKVSKAKLSPVVSDLLYRNLVRFVGDFLVFVKGPIADLDRHTLH